MSVPVLDLAAVAPTALLAALQQHGAVLVRDARVPQRTCDAALADAAAFFALPAAAKQALAIARSPHFRGYSEMHNERDWREQIHFGSERVALPAEASAHWRLQGPNQWPDDAAWRQRMLDYLSGVAAVGRALLGKVAEALGLRSEAWLGDDPYLLMKLIGYHAQPKASPQRNGVAAHVDFSLVTLTLQDDVGGLEVQRPDGSWCAVPCVRGAWLANVGELLQYVSGNRLVATPHRVVNPSAARSRHSIPVFVNPSLATTLRCELPVLATTQSGGAHVHAVLNPSTAPRELPFGPAEWRRKGENVWCAVCSAMATRAVLR